MSFACFGACWCVACIGEVAGVLFELLVAVLSMGMRLRSRAVTRWYVGRVGGGWLFCRSVLSGIRFAFYMLSNIYNWTRICNSDSVKLRVII